LLLLGDSEDPFHLPEKPLVLDEEPLPPPVREPSPVPPPLDPDSDGEPPAAPSKTNMGSAKRLQFTALVRKVIEDGSDDPFRDAVVAWFIDRPASAVAEELRIAKNASKKFILEARKLLTQIETTSGAPNEAARRLLADIEAQNKIVQEKQQVASSNEARARKPVEPLRAEQRLRTALRRLIKMAQDLDIQVRTDKIIRVNAWEEGYQVAADAAASGTGTKRSADDDDDLESKKKPRLGPCAWCQAPLDDGLVVTHNGRDLFCSWRHGLLALRAEKTLSPS
jgi:hypothetical protein